MSLGLLAKDSILDLEEYAREAEQLERSGGSSASGSDTSNSRSISLAGSLAGRSLAASSKRNKGYDENNSNENNDATAAGGVAATGTTAGEEEECMIIGGDGAPIANPQQAQEVDFDDIINPNNNNNRSASFTGGGGAYNSNNNNNSAGGAYSGFHSNYDPSFGRAASSPAAIQMYNNNNDNYFKQQQEQQQRSASLFHTNQMDFDTYTYYSGYHDTYAPVDLGMSGELGGGRENQTCWKCLFPWMSSSNDAAKQQNMMDGGFHDEHLTPTSMAGTGGEANDIAAIAAAAVKAAGLDDDDEGDQQQQQQQRESIATKTTSTAGSEQDDDAISTSSDVLGERLSDRERQAVLARLGLAQPDASGTNASDPEGACVCADGENSGAVGNSLSSSRSGSLKAPYSPATEKGLLNGIPTLDTSPLNEVPPLRGILKNRQSTSSVMPRAPTRSSDIMTLRNGVNAMNNAAMNRSRSVVSSAGPRRRSLFPQSYESTGRSKNYRVTYAPMARVVTIKSKNDMAHDEKADVWWQKSDYEDFRRTGRIITKAMLEGGGEIWLQGGSTGGNAKRFMDLSSKSMSGDLSAPGDKWWHKFGHSRRGLEHVVSFEEGRQRQMNVRTAIHAVLEEQERQRRYRRGPDAEKLRIVSLNNTSWARDLAMAAGASDADAVVSSFAEHRKSREFYLLKIARASPGVTMRRIPEFMQPLVNGAGGTSSTGGGGGGPGGHVRNASNGGSSAGKPTGAAPIPAARLDVNTASQIRFRRDKQKKSLFAAVLAAEQNMNSNSNSSTSATSLSSNATTASETASSSTSVVSATTNTTATGTVPPPPVPPAPPVAVVAEKKGEGDDDSVSCEPVRDTSDQKRNSLMSQMGKGFSTEFEDKMDMAAVLSGMGAVPSSQTAASRSPLGKSQKTPQLGTSPRK